MSSTEFSEKPTAVLTGVDAIPDSLYALPFPATGTDGAGSFEKTSTTGVIALDPIPTAVPIVNAVVSSSSTLPSTATNSPKLQTLQFPLPPNIVPTATEQSNALDETRQYHVDKRRVYLYAIYIAMLLLSFILMIISYSMPLEQGSSESAHGHPVRPPKSSQGATTAPGTVAPVQRMVLTVIFVVLAVPPVVWFMVLLVKDALRGFVGTKALLTMTTKPAREKVRDVEAGHRLGPRSRIIGDNEKE